MTEIIPFPQNCYFTVLRALPFADALDIEAYKLLVEDIHSGD